MDERKQPVDVMYVALSPRAPAFVQAPTLGMPRAVVAPSRSEVLRRQIAAAAGRASLFG